MNASCISEITDTTHSAEKGIYRRGNGDDSIPDINSNSNRHLQPSFVKGSLYSRIMSELQEVENVVINVMEETENLTDGKEGFSSLCAQSMGRDVSTDISYDGSNSLGEEIESNDEFADEDDVGMSTRNENAQFPTSQSLSVPEQESLMPMGANKGCIKGTEPKECVDQWREVHDDRTGKTYYYNRRTRESRWNIPANGLLVGRRRTLGRRLDKDFISLCDPLIKEVSMSDITGTESDFQCSISAFDSFRHTLKDATSTLTANTKINEALIQTPGEEITLTNIGGRDSVSQSCIDREIQGGRSQCCALFCMYCGVPVASANAMKEHLCVQCSTFQEFCRLNPLEHRHLQLVLDDVWKNSSSKNQIMKKTSKDIYTTVNSGGVGSSIGNPKNDTRNENYSRNDELFSYSDEEDTIIDFTLERHSQSISEEKNISTCAFCCKKFRAGTNLSRHLLLCKKRQRRNKKKTNETF
jgi:hypothetical protein